MAAVIGKAKSRGGQQYFRCQLPRATPASAALKTATWRSLRRRYYGGIKSTNGRRYRWHGVAVRRIGTKVDIHLGEPSDPVFTFNELLIHLAQEQMKRVKQRVKGETNLLVGSRPYGDPELKSGSNWVC